MLLRLPTPTLFPYTTLFRSTTIVDRRTSRRIEGVTGNNFSSYIRDYDFSVLLPTHNATKPGFSTPPGFGKLHGNLFKSDRKSTRLNSSHVRISYAVFCLKKK